MNAALHRFGHIDVLTDTAGRGSLGAAGEFAPAQLREQLELDFFAMIDVVESPDPPLTLILGADALGLWEKKPADAQVEPECWRETAFDDAVLVPIGG